MKKRAANGQIIALKDSKPPKPAGRTTYTPAEKQAAIARMAAKKSTCLQISKDTGIPEGTLYKWMREKRLAKGPKKTPTVQVVTQRINRKAEVKGMTVARSRDMSAILFDFVGNLALLAAEMRRKGI